MKPSFRIPIRVLIGASGKVFAPSLLKCRFEYRVEYGGLHEGFRV